MGVITTTYLGEMQFESQLGDHKILINGPDEWGGKNLGPAPPQLFMASIGSCVGVLVTHFCDTHDLDASGLSVVVEYDVADHPIHFNNIRVTVNLPHAHCDDACTKKALAHVAEHCPVHETIVASEEITFNINTN